MIVGLKDPHRKKFTSIFPVAKNRCHSQQVFSPGISEDSTSIDPLVFTRNKTEYSAVQIRFHVLIYFTPRAKHPFHGSLLIHIRFQISDLLALLFWACLINALLPSLVVSENTSFPPRSVYLDTFWPVMSNKGYGLLRQLC